MSISKIKEINKKFDEKFTMEKDSCFGLHPLTSDRVKRFYTQQILSLIEELIGEDEDIKHTGMLSSTDPRQTRNEFRDQMRASIKSYKKGL